ncbi:hypothetical protein Bca101_092097 [Brassica carinata]
MSVRAVAGALRNTLTMWGLRFSFVSSILRLGMLLQLRRRRLCLREVDASSDPPSSVLSPGGEDSLSLASPALVCLTFDWIDEALRNGDKAWKRRVDLDGGSSVFLSSRFAVSSGDISRWWRSSRGGRDACRADKVLSFYASCFLDARAYRNRPSLVWTSSLLTCLSGP